MARRETRGSSAHLAVLGAALLFSTGGAAIKATTLDAWQVAGFRSGIATVAFLICFPAARRRWTGRTLLVGVAYGATLLCYVIANKLTTAANSIFLQSTGPLYIAMLAPWLLREHIRRRDVGFMLVLAIGLSLFFLTETPMQTSAPNPRAGNLAAAVSGLGWAFTVMGLRWVGREAHGGDTALAATTIGNVLVFACCLPLTLGSSLGGPLDLLVVTYLGLFQLALAYVLLTSGIRHVPAVEASLLLLLEPALNPVWTWLAHGERPGPWAMLGGAIILAATTVKAGLDSRALRSADRPRR